ncbi:VOC family protein [Terricaulis silvestris]|uniref:Methylmalonyl-CoA epimerase n=1 Tax=Terricaulis silvestris TaxID=2686094 RepID=A0A6I6MRD3_9CAUL|nr:methylmalonyl-CoA epimerase [Terricaulis silvestris]
MIEGIDHVVIGVRDLDAGIQAYETLLGRRATARVEHNAVATALIATDNVAVELMAPIGESDDATRLRAAMDDGGEGSEEHRVRRIRYRARASPLRACWFGAGRDRDTRNVAQFSDR